MERTVKIPAYSGDQKQGTPKDNLTKEQKLALELAAKNTQLEEEKSKSLDLQKTIEQLRDTLRHEQARAAELTSNSAGLEAKVKELQDLLKHISDIASGGKAA